MAVQSLGCPGRALVRAGGSNGLAHLQELFLCLGAFVLNWGATAPDQALRGVGQSSFVFLIFPDDKDVRWPQAMC